MRFCIALAYNPPLELLELARTAEASGFDSVVVSDHLVYPAKLRTPYPYTRDGAPRWDAAAPWPDPFVAVGAMAAVTERLRFITSVLVLPVRHPVLVAKTAGTAAVMSNNRLTLGVGAGWMQEEFELVGACFEDRGRRIPEMLEVIRKLWSGRPVAHHGEYYDFEAVEMSPSPSEPIPIYGGGLSPPALRRAAQLCDGWASEIQSTDELREIIPRLNALRADSALAGRPFDVCAAVRDAFTLDGFRQTEEQGVTHAVTVPWLFYAGKDQTLEQKCDGIRRFGDEVVGSLP